MVAPNRVLQSNLANRQEHRGARWIVGLMAFAAFGPYLVGGIRTEQMIIYVFFLAALLAFPNMKPRGWSYLLPWAGILAVATIAFLFPVMQSTPWGAGSLFGGIDNFLLPVAVMLIVWTLVKRSSALPALATAARVIVWASVGSATLGILATQFELTRFLRPFWASAQFEGTVAERAESMGRYSGIFNHPAEAGLVYSLAIILGIWLYAKKPARLYAALVVLTVGGILTVSKIFIFVGLPLGLWHLIRHYRFGGKLLTLAALAGIFTLISASGFVQEWNGFDYFSRLFEVPQGSAIEFYTAGRWDEGSGMLTVMSTVLATSPLGGFGFAGLKAPYDSAWTEVMVVSGMLGVAAMALVLGSVFIQAYRTSDPKMSQLTYLIGLLLLGASFGLPAFTANRAATMVWLILALLALARTPRTRKTIRSNFSSVRPIK